jgi:site-specific DNA recombinase
MPNPEFFREEFDRLATNGAIGDPAGKPAYAYIRVSSSGQAEEGRSGLPRQIEHCHEIALQKGYRIAWAMVFADDDTGTEFEYRPQLTSLRSEIKTPDRRGQAVIMEHLDRLSRNADWHQGYLLDEMKRHAITPVFWKSFSSRIEQAVMGAVAHDGMEQAKARMLDGTKRKAKDGRVTSKHRLYGYNFVDQHGVIQAKPGKWTYYAIQPTESIIVKRIFASINKGTNAHHLSEILNREGIKPPGKMRWWSQGQICHMVKNPAYKGEFVEGRTRTIRERRIDEFGNVKKHVHVEFNPPEDWIIVPVPAIIDPADWALANAMLDQNKKTAKRNAKNPYLLSGLLKCFCCGRTYTGVKNRTVDKRNGRNTVWQRLDYHIRNGSVTARRIRNCQGSQIAAHLIEDNVWSVVFDFLAHPDRYAAKLDQMLSTDRNRALQEQIDFLTHEIDQFPASDDMLTRAYLAHIFDESEFAAKRHILKSETQQKIIKRDELLAQVISPQVIEDRKRAIYSIATLAHGLPADPPFEIKQKLIRLVVDKIILDTTRKEFEIIGICNGTHSIVNGSSNKTNHNTRFYIRYSYADHAVLSVDIVL